MRRGSVVVLLGAILAAGGCGSSDEEGPAVVGVGGDGGPGIYRHDADGSVRRLTRNKSDEFPTWSPDGSEVAFDRVVFAPDAAVGEVHLFVVNRDGGGLRDVVGHASLTAFSWSPDGRRLAYRDGEGTIRTIGIDGTNAKLVYRSVLGHEPAWSPDGRTIVFFEDTFSLDSNGRLLAARADRAGVRTLLALKDDDAYLAASPSWSPDGKRIAFVRGNPDSAAYPTALEVVRADGSGRHVLWKLRVPESDLDLVRPQWSPEGDSITYADVQEGAFGLWSISTEGGEPRLLLERVKDAMPSWARDGG